MICPDEMWIVNGPECACETKVSYSDDNDDEEAKLNGDEGS